MTKDECQAGCGHLAKEFKTDSICKMDVQVGGCPDQNRTLPRWSYDRWRHTCLPFYYSGCGGNENNFDSKAECVSVCPTSYPASISLPKGPELLVRRGTEEFIIPVKGGREVFEVINVSFIEFESTVRANPEAKTQWIRKGRVISEFESPYQILEDASLRIRDVSDLDAGFFTIQASNGIGKLVLPSDATPSMLHFTLKALRPRSRSRLSSIPSSPRSRSTWTRPSSSPRLTLTSLAK